MKKLYVVLSLCCFSVLTFGQIVNIPDANFKNALTNNLCIDTDSNGLLDDDVDSNNDGEIQVSEALATTNLRLSDNGITSIQGIDNFTNLQYFDCSLISLGSLHLSNLPNLIGFGCESCQLFEITADNLPNLQRFSVTRNFLSSIDLSNTPAFDFDFSFNPDLQNINMQNGVVSQCIVLLSDEYDYTCSMFLECPSLQVVCGDIGEQFFYQGLNVNFTTDCSLNTKSNVLSTFEVYPNPTASTLHVKFSETNTIESISIFNILGQELPFTSNQSNEEKITLDISSLKAGTYFIKITSNNGKTTKKFVKL